MDNVIVTNSKTRRHTTPQRLYEYIHPNTDNNAKPDMQRTGMSLVRKRNIDAV
jgi:hypothetical protein